MKFISLNNPPLLYLALPFYFDFIIKYFNEKSLMNFFYGFIIIILFDLINTYIYRNIKFKICYSLTIIIILVSFLYYGLLINLVKIINEHTVNFKINSKLVYIILISFIAIILFKRIKKNKKSFYYINFILLIFSAVIIGKYVFENIFVIKYKPLISHPIKYKGDSEKPIILIIADEYSSPIELFKIFHDKNLYNFQNKLIKNHWQINSRVFTKNIHTINSVSSLFNYNYKLNDNEIKISEAESLLKKSKLVSDILNKNIRFYNFSIFDIHNQKAISKIYFYDKEKITDNFLMTLLSNTSISNLISKTENPEIFYNRLNIESNIKNIDNFSGKSFIYLHILMPHAPYKYYTYEPKKLNKNYSILNQYYDYWNFSNETYIELLTKLTKEKKFKIIFCGDHGFRSDKNINPFLTFSAYYGFDSTEVNKINSIQDIGSLINSNF